MPGPIARSKVAPGLHAGAAVPAGLPSTLIERRPDVLSVEQQVVAANAQIGVAKADFFPRFSLTALAGFASPDLTKLFDPSKSFVWNASGSVNWLAPILQGDALHGQAEAASAQWEQAKNTYESTVLTAFREVADALDDVKRLDGVVQQREEEVANLTEAVGLAVDRFYGGVSSYLEVTTTQNLLFPAELNLAAVRAQRTTAFVNLYRALGGGWQLPPPADASSCRTHGGPAAVDHEGGSSMRLLSSALVAALALAVPAVADDATAKKPKATYNKKDTKTVNGHGEVHRRADPSRRADHAPTARTTRSRSASRPGTCPRSRSGDEVVVQYQEALAVEVNETDPTKPIARADRGRRHRSLRAGQEARGGRRPDGDPERDGGGDRHGARRSPPSRARAATRSR